MTAASNPSMDELDLPANLSPPMENGELVFAAPWQGRIFGMAKALCDLGLYQWDEFRAHLIAEIAKHDAQHAHDEAYEYYDHFQAALLALIQEKKLLTPQELEGRFQQLEARPHGHDH